MHEVLKALGLEEVNAGAWAGGRPLPCDGGRVIDSVNPATGEVLGRVKAATPADYETAIELIRFGNPSADPDTTLQALIALGLRCQQRRGTPPAAAAPRRAANTRPTRSPGRRR